MISTSFICIYNIYRSYHDPGIYATQQHYNPGVLSLLDLPIQEYEHIRRVLPSPPVVRKAIRQEKPDGTRLFFKNKPNDKVGPRDVSLLKS